MPNGERRQKKVDAKLAKVLTTEQRKALAQMRAGPGEAGSGRLAGVWPTWLR